MNIVNINDLAKTDGFAFYCKTTDEYYVAFRIRQLSPAINDFWGFGLVTFDVYGSIQLRENPDQEPISFAADNVTEDLPKEGWDHFMNMTNVII